MHQRLFTLLLISIIVLLPACAGRPDPDCSPQAGFDRGRSERPIMDGCQSAAYASAWRLGQNLGELERERLALNRQVAPLSPQERARLRVLSREIPELKTLARLDGLMPAAAAPDQ